MHPPVKQRNSAQHSSDNTVIFRQHLRSETHHKDGDDDFVVNDNRKECCSRNRFCEKSRFSAALTVSRPSPSSISSVVMGESLRIDGGGRDLRLSRSTIQHPVRTHVAVGQWQHFMRRLMNLLGFWHPCVGLPNKSR